MAIASDTKTVVGVFNSVSDAQAAVSELESQGISRSDVSIVANKNATGYDTMDPADRDKASDVVADAGIGAAIGGVGGLLLSAAGALTIPVIGPILAAGPIAAALTGAGIGAAAGGLIGALTESGVPEEHAHVYAEGVRRGDVLVTVKTHGGNADTIASVLDRHHAIDVDDRVQDWKSRGWSGFQNDAKPYSEDELREERKRYIPSTYGHTEGTGTVTGQSGMGVDRERARLEASDATMGSTGMTGLGLSGAGHSSAGVTGDTSHTYRDTTHNVRNDARDVGDKMREGMHEAGDKMREWGHDVKEKFGNAGEHVRHEADRTGDRVGQATSSWNPGQPNRGDTGDRVSDNAAEAGREIKEFGRDTKDVLTGHTETRPHDVREEVRDAERERRRRSRIY